MGEAKEKVLLLDQQYENYALELEPGHALNIVEKGDECAALKKRRWAPVNLWKEVMSLQVFRSKWLVKCVMAEFETGMEAIGMQMQKTDGELKDFEA